MANDDIFYHAEEDGAKPAASIPLDTHRQMPAINLFARLHQASTAKPVAVPTPDTAAATAPTTPPERSGSNARAIALILLGLAVVTGAGIGLYLLLRQPAAPAVVPPSPTPSPSPRFTPRPSPSNVPTPLPTTRPATPPPAGITYTVQPGDTLITIAQKYNKDWQAIAAANGGITDPNLIYPGQVLRIP